MYGGTWTTIFWGHELFGLSSRSFVIWFVVIWCQNYAGVSFSLFSVESNSIARGTTQSNIRMCGTFGHGVRQVQAPRIRRTNDHKGTYLTSSLREAVLK